MDMKIRVAYTKIHTKHINAFYVQEIVFLNVKFAGILYKIPQFIHISHSF